MSETVQDADDRGRQLPRQGFLQHKRSRVTVRSLQQQLLKNKAQLQRLMARRLGVSLPSRTFEEAADQSRRLQLAGFHRLVDQTVHDAVALALYEDTPAKMLQGVGRAMDCDESQVCLMNQRTITRGRQPVDVWFVRYAYDPKLNELIRQGDKPMFDKAERCWKLAEGAKTDAVLAEFRQWFQVVVDTDVLGIHVNLEDARPAHQQPVAFHPMPFHVQVHLDEVLAAIDDWRGRNEVKQPSLYVHDGNRFVPYPRERDLFTRLPFLLLRYAATGGRPRYACYSTLARKLEQLSFGNAHDDTRLALARFMGAVRRLTPADVLGSQEQLRAENPGDRTAYRGCFDQFAACLERVNQAVLDLRVLPLCCDYVSLVESGHGADTHHSGVIAYTYPLQHRQEYLHAIGAFFGESQEGCAVMFAREALHSWTSASDGEAKLVAVCAHELAHWLREEIGATAQDLSHDLLWAILADVLLCIYAGTIRTSNCRHERPDDALMEEMLVRIVPEVVDARIDRLGAKPWVTRPEVVLMAIECLNRLEAAFDTLDMPGTD